MRGETGDPGPSYSEVYDDDQPSTSAPNGSAEYEPSHSSDGDIYIKHTVGFVVWVVITNSTHLDAGQQA